jgi:two-component system, chemotaxis family, protein-glutamate methylesterase/glutaminase
VVNILREWPADFTLPLLLVIHISRAFGAGFAEWLNGLSPLPVAFAREGEPLPSPGAARVVLAPPDLHLIVAGGRLRLTQEPERHSCRPSVDVLFESVARELGPRAAACLLTGMGRDGATGLLAVRQAGGVTIAQDESTSVVFGMPREAIRLDAAGQVLRLDQIAPALAALARKSD